MRNWGRIVTLFYMALVICLCPALLVVLAEDLFAAADAPDVMRQVLAHARVEDVTTDTAAQWLDSHADRWKAVGHPA